MKGANQVGKRYGRLTIKGHRMILMMHGKRRSKVTVECDCGSVKETWLQNLRSGDTVSCGCFNKEKGKEAIKQTKKGPH